MDEGKLEVPDRLADIATRTVEDALEETRLRIIAFRDGLSHIPEYARKLRRLDAGPTQLDNETMSNELWEFLAGQGSLALHVPVNQALDFLLHAQERSARSEERAAWSYLCRASYWCGLAEAAGWQLANGSTDAREYGGMGSDERWGTKEHRDAAKQFLVKRLVEEPGGWGTKSKTADVLGAELETFVRDSKSTVRIRDYHTYVTNQLRSNLEVRNAYEQNRKSKPKSP